MGSGWRLAQHTTKEAWPTSCIQDRSRVGCGSPEFGAPPISNPSHTRKPRSAPKTQMCRKGFRILDCRTPQCLSKRRGVLAFYPMEARFPPLTGVGAEALQGNLFSLLVLLAGPGGFLGSDIDGGFYVMSGDVNVGWMLRQFWAWNRNLAVQERGARYVCFGHWGGGPRSGRGPQSRRWRVKPKGWWGIPSASETAMRKCQAWAHALARENGARREALGIMYCGYMFVATSLHQYVLYCPLLHRPLRQYGAVRLDADITGELRESKSVSSSRFA